MYARHNMVHVCPYTCVVGYQHALPTAIHNSLTTWLVPETFGGVWLASKYCVLLLRAVLLCACACVRACVCACACVRACVFDDLVVLSSLAKLLPMKVDRLPSEICAALVHRIICFLFLGNVTKNNN